MDSIIDVAIIDEVLETLAELELELHSDPLSTPESTSNQKQPDAELGKLPCSVSISNHNLRHYTRYK